MLFASSQHRAYLKMTRNRRRYDSTTRQDRRRQADLFRLHKLSLCQYLSWYFSPSTQHDIVHNHRPKLFNSNWTQLKHLIIQLAREDGRDARGRINNWISNQMKRTKPAFVSSHDMAPEVLASDQIDARLDATVESNSFISGRIRNLLSHCGDPPPVEESNCDKLSSDFTDVDMEDAQEDSSGSDAERGCFKEQHVSFLCRSIMGQIAFACNRRNNAMQHRNGLMALASDRKGNSLNSIDGDRRGAPLTGGGVCTGMVDPEGGSDVVDWRCGPKVGPVRRSWLIHVGAKNRPSGSVREPAPSRK
ncbi:BQ5605_C003g02168 [Microbotryum silenes-dioicae]|uniref:BQ5605_C003g02168 protein n=1 Tax=Microbotryum silenes-dioicae TaxID=796604 RepID=A0A2X0M0V4_9BASI|nr:BQ5605_C003g02168 [Microbotryum silenes-dioicae]